MGWIPIIFFIEHLSTYDAINESLTYEYAPSSLSPTETLILNANVGHIEINYITPPVNYHVKINVNIEMSGSKLASKNYSDYFRIGWQNTSSFPNFNVELLSDDWLEPSMEFMNDISIVVSIRKDIVFDIITTVNKGDVEITVPYGVSINNLLVNVSKGDIFYNFNYCTLEGNITGIVNTGNIFYNLIHCTIEGNLNGIVKIGEIELDTFNTKYTQNNSWVFTVDSGNFKIDINQYEDLGAIITGLVKINDG
jgi:hypothetical protein